MRRSTAALLASLFLAGAVFAPGCSDDTSSTGNVEGCQPNEVVNPLDGKCELATPSGNDAGIDSGDTGGANDSRDDADSGLSFQPSSLLFQYTSLLEASSQQVTLRNVTDSDLTVSAIDVTGDAAEFTVSGLTADSTIAAHSSVAISVRFAPLDSTDDSATLRVHVDERVAAQVTLTSQLREQTGDVECGEHCPKLQVNPTALNFSYQPSSAPQQQEIYIGNVGNATLTIYNVLVAQQGNNFQVSNLTTPQDIPPQQSVAVPVTFTPGDPRYDSARVIIQSNDPWDDEVEVPLEANSKGEDPLTPCIAVNPTTLDFGSLVRGQELTLSFQITNCGESELEVQSIDRGDFFGLPTPQSFQITNAPNMPATVLPGQSESVDVRYRPGPAGMERGFFLVKSNADTPSVRVNVRGTSEMPPRDTQDISIEMEWDADDCDVDSHFVRLPPDKLWCDNDCFYSNMSPDWGVQGDWEDDPFLDTDDVDGFGPEHINLQRAESVTYKYVLHYWRDSHEGSFSTDTNATVKLYIGGTLVQTFGPYHLQSTGDTVDVFTLEWPSQTVTELNNSYHTPSSVSCQ